MDPKTTPEEIELRSQDRSFRVMWGDDHMTVFRNRDLRLACRCAACVEEMTGRPLLDPATVPDDIDITDVEEVGNYGLKITWQGGHSTGIYTWDRLRSLDPSAPENKDKSTPVEAE